jgi:hypothetical protein
VTFNGRQTLYAAWKGKVTSFDQFIGQQVSDQRLFYATFDADKWSLPPAKNQTVPGNSSIGPSLAAGNGQLAAFWKGIVGDQRLFFSTLSQSGGTWAAARTLPGNTSPDWE